MAPFQNSNFDNLGGCIHASKNPSSCVFYM